MQRVAVLLVLGLPASAVPAAETIGNFHTIGIVLELPGSLSPGQVSQVRVSMLDGTSSRRLLDAVQIRDESFYAVSVFGLQPGQRYRFRAEFIGSTGRVLSREEFGGQTRAQPVEPGEPAGAVQAIHVASTGVDSNPGTVGRPKQTIASALAAVKRPGTQVVVHQGVYFEGDLVTSARGTARMPIVVRGARGESVIIDGSDTGVGTTTWKELGGGLFSTPFKGQSWVVCVRHAQSGSVRRLYPVGSLAKLKSRRVGKFGFAEFRITEAYFCTGSEVVVYCPYFKPRSMTLHVARRGGFVEHSRAQHIVYCDLTCRFFQGQVFYVNDSSDITLRRCRFEYCALPIAIKRASNRLLVERCHFVDDCNRWGFLPKGMDDVGYSGRIETGAVYVHNPYEGRGLVFRNNVIDGLFDGVHLAPMGPPSKVKTHETDFHGNRVLNVCDDFIEADGQCGNLRIFDNTMVNCLSGISVAQGYQGPTYVLYNVLSGFGNSSASRLPPRFEGYPVKTNGGTRYGTTGWVFFFHNTCHTSIPNTGAFRVQEAQWRKLILANNIWQGTRDGLVFWREKISPISMSGDLLHVKTGVLAKVRKTGYATLGEARRRLPFLKGVRSGDPRFRDPGQGDFRLRAGSPAIDTGLVIPGVNDLRFLGNAPDVGALESKPGS